MSDKSVMSMKPGLLVALSSRMEGGVKYDRKDLETEKSAGDEASISKWETTKVVEDPEEHARASSVRSKCRSTVSSVCTHTAFGLLCLASKEERLNEAIATAKAMAEAFNATAKTVRIGIFALKGRIAETDDEAARAVSSELRGLLDEMQGGIAEGNVKRIREAAATAKKMGAVLDDATGKKVAKAVDEARSIAKDIMKKLSEGGNAAEQISAMVTAAKLEAIKEARFAFLDFEETAAKADAERLPSTNARALDMSDDDDESSLEDDGVGSSRVTFSKATSARELDV